MKPYILGLVFAVVVVLPPLAHADTVPIGDPYTDTTRLWSELAEALSSLANDVAAFFHNHHLATGVPAGSAVGESAAVATAVTSFAAAQESGTTPPVLPQSAATTTIVNNYITNPIESVVEKEPLASSEFVTQEQLTAAIFAVSQKLTPEQTELLPQWVAADGNPSVPYAAVSNITNLSGVTISNATISGGSVPSSSLTGTIANAIDTATGEIDSLSGADLVYTAATTTNATSTNLFASNLAASALSVSGTTTLPILDLSSLNCSTFGNGGKLTTDAFGNVTCAADQGGSGSTIGGSDMEVQFNSGGSFQGSSSFTFASSTDRLTVTNASTTNITASYASSTNLVVGNATSTNLFASLANLTTGIIGSLSGSQLTYTAASTTNLSNTGTAYFGATATSSFNNAGQLTLANLASAVLGVNSSGQVVATTTIGTNLLTGTLGTINGASLSAGGTITITAASSTLLANNNTWTGLQQFANASSTLETDWTLWLPNTTSALLKTTGSGQVAAAIAGTDYQIPITASYPISFSGNNLSLAFGTTTANTFLQLQTLSGGASTTNMSASGEGYFATASTTNLTVSGSPSGFLQTNAQGVVSATSTFSAGSIFGTFPVANGGTGSTTLTGILKGNGTGAIQTAVGGTDYEFPLTFSTGLNRTGNTITNTGVLSLGSGYATTTGTSITLSTTTQSFNGLTIAQQITSPNGSDLLFTPAITGTLSNAGLAHSSITLNGTPLTLGDTDDTITAASSTLLGDTNTFSGNDTFRLINLSATSSSLLGVSASGAVVATTSIGTNLLTGILGTINGTNFSVGGSITLGSASTTLLNDNNTFSGGNLFTASTTIGNGNQNGGLTVSGGATTTGNLIVEGSGTSTFLGNIGIGGNIVPSADNTYALGSPSYEWKDVYIGPGSLFVNGQEVVHTDASQNVVLTANSNQNLEMQTSGTGSVLLNSSGTGNIQLAGPVQITGGENFSTSNATPVLFNDGVEPGNLELTGNAIQAANTNGGISFSPNGNGGTYFTNGNVGIGTTNPLSKLEVEGAVAALNFSATSTTATSTFADGISLAGGCFAVNGTCVGASSASSTLLGDNNAFSGVDSFTNVTSNFAGTWQTLSPSHFDTFAYPFPLNATSTTLTFSDGLSALASTTIGNGTQSGGLTISGGATTTANFLVQGTLAAQGAAFTGTTGTTTIAFGQGFTIGGSQFVVQQGSGNVGIGTTSPAGHLGINAELNGSRPGLYIDARTRTTGDNVFYLAGSSAADDIVIQAGGNVGIGTTTPQGALDVYSNGNAGNLFGAQLTLEGNSNQVGLDLYNAQANSGKGWGIWASGGSGSPASGFSIWDYTTGSTALYIATSSANVGIGTINPGSLLDVGGEAKSEQDFYASDVGVPQLVLDSAGTDYGQIINNSGNTWSLGYGGSRTSSGTSVLTWNGSGNIEVTGASQFDGSITEVGASDRELFVHDTSSGREVSLTTNQGGNVPSVILNNNGDTSQIDEESNGSLFIYSGVGNTYTYFTSAGDLQVTGCVTYDGGTDGSCLSDQRLKDNVSSFNDGLSTIAGLDPVTYQYNGQAGTPDDVADGEVRNGLIAQQVEQVAPDLVATTSGQLNGATTTLYEVKYSALTFALINAVKQIANVSSTFEQNLIAWLGNAQNGIIDLFAQNIHAQNELCVGSTCVTPTQFEAMVAAAGEASSSGQGNSSTQSDDAATSSSDASATLPVLQVNGDNPALIQVGATYNDLGATITGPQYDLNLGIQTFVNGVAMSPVQVDTSASATDTVQYVATDQNGLTCTSTRTVIIEPTQAPSIVPTDDASSTDATTSDATSTSS